MNTPENEKVYSTDADDVYGNEENNANTGKREPGKEEDFEDADFEQEDDRTFQVSELVDKAKEYFKQNFSDVDKDQMLKYASMAVIAVYGIRKSGIVSSILISLAVGVLAKYLLANQPDLKAETE